MDNKAADKLLREQKEHLEKLHQIVKETIKEEELIIGRLLHPPAEILSRGQSISDKVASFGGSWKFIISFMVFLAAWIVFNVLALSYWRFDPYPFILMNLVLSCLAALQAPVIMMSQNRKEEKDRKRAENDYLVNLKAEMEIRSLHQKMDLLLQEQVKALFNSQAEQINMLKEINAKLDKLAK